MIARRDERSPVHIRSRATACSAQIEQFSGVLASPPSNCPLQPIRWDRSIERDRKLARRRFDLIGTLEILHVAPLRLASSFPSNGLTTRIDRRLSWRRSSATACHIGSPRRRGDHGEPIPVRQVESGLMGFDHDRYDRQQAAHDRQKAIGPFPMIALSSGALR
jgi:hypothetical protein